MKHTRAPHSKVRTGCHTCKTRRIKCDETRPACLKCTSAGRTCEGYHDTRDWIVVVAPHHLHLHPDASAPAPALDGFDDDRSRRHFEYFRSFAVFELSWFLKGRETWGSLVLREAQTSAAVRHAIIALSCTHEDFRDGTTDASNAPQYGYAADHYSKAIRNLIKETTDDGQANRVRTLICGLLFISIEVLRANCDAARNHLDGCLKIVQEAQDQLAAPSSATGHLTDADRHLSELLIPIFNRMDIQTSLVLDLKPANDKMIPIVWVPSQHVAISDPSNSIPFTTLVEAGNSLLLIENRVHQFQNHYSDLYHFTQTSNIPLSVMEDKMTLRDQLVKWEQATLPLLNANMGASPSEILQYEKLQLLRIHSRVHLTQLENSLHVEECRMDAFHWAFQDIVDFTAEIMARQIQYDSLSEGDGSPSPQQGRATPAAGPSQSTTPPTATFSGRNTSSSSPAAVPPPLHAYSQPTFVLDNGLIFPLYWTSLKCRNPGLRRRAIQLLSALPTIQEGNLVSFIQAAVSRRVVELEEDQLYDEITAKVGEAKDVAEWRRVHGVRTEVDKARRSARIVVVRRAVGGGWEEGESFVDW